jgi:polyisoprenoid-binding protein YceI
MTTTNENSVETAKEAAEQVVEQARTAAAERRVVDGVQLPEPGTYVLDAAHTRIGFIARHLMVTKVRGFFADFDGSITIDADPAKSTAQAGIRTASIETGAPDRDNHLRSGDFLEAEKYPEIFFGNARVVSQDGATFTVVGDLTIKGVTRPAELEVELDGVVTDPFGNEKLALTATTEIDREDFGMTWNVALETGGVLVSRKVKIEIEAQAVRQA